MVSADQALHQTAICSCLTLLILPLWTYGFLVVAIHRQDTLCSVYGLYQNRDLTAISTTVGTYEDHQPCPILWCSCYHRYRCGIQRRRYRHHDFRMHSKGEILESAHNRRPLSEPENRCTHQRPSQYHHGSSNPLAPRVDCMETTDPAPQKDWHHPPLRNRLTVSILLVKSQCPHLKHDR